MGQIVDDYRSLLTKSSWWHDVFTNKPIFLTYSFETSPFDDVATKPVPASFLRSFQVFNDAEKAAARDALGQWDAACGIVFLEAPAGQGDIRFGNYDFSLFATVAAHKGSSIFPDTAFTPGSAYTTMGSGDVFVNTTSMSDHASDLTHLMLHLIGHTIGLKNPQDGNYHLSPAYDSGTYTVLSANGKLPTLGSFDIQAAQSYYGTDAEDGHQVPSWSWNAARATLTQTGDAGDNAIRGVASTDVMRGLGGKDHLFGSGGGDRLDGGSGDDRLDGGDGVDLLSGGSGNDNLHGGAGDDMLVGGAGDDVLYGGGSKVARADEGSDTADYSGSNAGVTVMMHGADRMPFDHPFRTGLVYAWGAGIGHDQFHGIDNVIGTGGKDVITGDGFANVLKGGAGADILAGGAGDDTLDGGLGIDQLTGGAGSDHFLFDSKYGGSNVTTLTDFQPGHDKIVLDQDAFHALTRLGTLSSPELRVGTAAQDATDRIIYDKATGDLFFDPDGIGGHGQTRFAELQPGLNLHGADFLVIA